MITSVFAEVDSQGRGSNPNPGNSTAEDCYQACMLNVDEAEYTARISVSRYEEGIRDRTIFQYETRDLSKIGNVKRNRWGDPILTPTGVVLCADKYRALGELRHWRDMAEWWGARAAEDPGKVRQCGLPSPQSLPDDF